MLATVAVMASASLSPPTDKTPIVFSDIDYAIIYRPSSVSIDILRAPIVVNHAIVGLALPIRDIAPIVLYQV